jgi:hypothetical protein
MLFCNLTEESVCGGAELLLLQAQPQDLLRLHTQLAVDSAPGKEKLKFITMHSRVQ